MSIVEKMATTMNLEQVEKESELRGIVSDGEFLVMANEVLLLVNYKLSSSSAAATIFIEPPAAAVKSSFPIYSTLPPAPPDPMQKQTHHHHHLRKLAADLLPMQRRSSISRFLECRKNRMMARAPYN
ncbi:uncharacterized protein LOC124912680 isoform X2 [Impatiens glandulifera]|uniref:uncharacterized protein LOC124912680 isoform X2 n=1 Tax=Impatiens glandulifera TaxID=253017 RepID=UPI001FB0BBBC|nr:uncharacterized protein LOC124912680 isoform X2 [Impatiens glandulifera]